MFMLRRVVGSMDRRASCRPGGDPVEPVDHRGSQMTHPGTVRKTYGAALRLGAATPGADDLVVFVGAGDVGSGSAAPGVGRSIPAAGTAVGDALAPPTGLQFDLDRALTRDDGGNVDDAWAAVDYETRYRTFLADDREARAELTRLRRHLATGGTVWLVCPGNTPLERRHRAVLADVLDERTRDDGGDVT
jgi:hypothetical protein